MDKHIIRLVLWNAFFVNAYAHASSTKTFEFRDAVAMTAADLDGIAVMSTGSLVPSARFRRTDIKDAAVAYVGLRARDGALWLGTGHEGRIVKMVGDKVVATYETRQVLVTTLLQLPTGDILAGTIPEGRIFQITSRGILREWLKLPGADHIWAMVYDPIRRVIFAGTGPHGRVLEINASNKTTKLVYDGEVQHILSLAWANDKQVLYAGTSDKALLLSIRPDAREGDKLPRASVLNDFSASEVTALAYRGGALAIAVNDFGALGRSVLPVKSDVKGTAPAELTSLSKTATGKGRLWWMDAQGRLELLYQNDETYFPTVTTSVSGAFFVGTAKDGRLMRVLSNRQWAVWADTDDRQILSILEDAQGLTLLTGDVAGVYQVDGKQKTLQWTSKPLDARTVSRWGRLDWRARAVTPLSFQTRTGNTEKPDDHWSPWSKPMVSPSTMTSPSARYLQIRANFGVASVVSSSTGGVHWITAYYLPQNERAFVNEVSAKFSIKDKAKITWKVDNADGDSLRYRLRFRADTQDIWRDVQRPHEYLSTTEYTWDVSGLPDGYYIFQVEAYDDLQNPSPRAWVSRGESAAVLIDNHAPDVIGLRWDGKQLSGMVRDRVGPIAKIEYAINSGEWKVVLPDDGVFDGPQEGFHITISTLAGPAVFAVRATDALGHVGSAELFGKSSSVIKQ